MNVIISLLGVIFIWFKACYTYKTGGRHINPCKNPGNNEAVEHFFNMVFTEFHDIPPACICIQMCFEHPTYCYPNGCLKRPEKEKKIAETKPVVDSVNVKSSKTPKSVMFLVENHNHFVDDMTNYAEEITAIPQPMELIYRPNPFRELVLKYKKVPKLQMRYNLREQVKNMKYDKLKRDQIDVSKTRWPINRHLLHGRKPIHGIRHYKKNDEKRQSKFLATMFPELANENNYAPKFYKKYLTKRENNNGVKVESLYLYKADAANFSLETLIDSLIENSLDWSKSKNNSNISKLTENNFIPCINHTHEQFQTKGNRSNTENTVNIISINSTNEKIDTNKYLPNTNSTNEKDYLEMIAIMSEGIDKQNKVSLDFMKRSTGNRSVDLSNSISGFESISQETIAVNRGPNIALHIIDTNIVTTNVSNADSMRHTSSTTSRNVLVPMIKKGPLKSKQRVVRKLKNKVNKF